MSYNQWKGFGECKQTVLSFNPTVCDNKSSQEGLYLKPGEMYCVQQKSRLHCFFSDLKEDDGCVGTAPPELLSPCSNGINLCDGRAVGWGRAARRDVFVLVSPWWEHCAEHWEQSWSPGEMQTGHWRCRLAYEEIQPAPAGEETESISLEQLR